MRQAEKMARTQYKMSYKNDLDCDKICPLHLMKMR